MQVVTHTEFDNDDLWYAAWSAGKGRGSAKKAVRDANVLREMAHFAAGALLVKGYRLFQNGGIPLLERRFGAWREEILFVPAPEADRRPEHPFSIRIHISSEDVGRVRSRYWRPASRAPVAVAGGDIGELTARNRKVLWFGSGGVDTAEAVANRLMAEAIPFFEAFHQPKRLKERLYTRNVPFVDDSTALELLLAIFDPYEARQFLYWRLATWERAPGGLPEPSGHSISGDRIGAISAYYRLA